MQVTRYAGHLVFAAAALASIATSYASPWILTDSEIIEPTNVGPGPALDFGITAEARGPRNGHQGGELVISLRLEMPFTETPAQTNVTVVLASETDPEQRDEQSTIVSSGGFVELVHRLPAWLVCEAGPCFDDFKLSIGGVEGGAQITVSGNVDITLEGRDPSPSPDHEAVLTVTQLGAL